MTILEQEPIIPVQQVVRMTPPKPGDVGRHEVPGLRRYTVLRFSGRQEFVFSTLSSLMLAELGAIYVCQA
jgi:hypothetical protein